MKRTPISFFVFLLFLLFVSACSSLKSSSNADEENFPIQWSQSAFPHPEGWQRAAMHGVWVNSTGSDQCMICHSSGGNAEDAAPPCSLCHALFPHEDGWESKDKHGQYALTNGSETCATQCHGTDLKGGLSQISCATCHAMYPHPSGWREASSHGESARTQGVANCEACHGEDLNGGSSGVGCRSCHLQYPHAVSWQNPENHGAFVLNVGDDGCKSICHGEDLSGGLSQVSCTSCHSLYPHNDTWAQSHGSAAVSLGNSACAACHGNDYEGGQSGVGCHDCHADYPHPARATWIPNEGGHGEAAHSSPEGLDRCKVCHGADLTGGSSNVSCMSCHADYPHTQPNWVAGISSVHASTFIARISAGETAACQDCHGADYNRDVGSGRCLGCHPDGITHTAGWATGAGHGVYYSSRFTSTSADQNCKDCHGAPVEFSDLKRVSHDCWKCHTFGISATPPTSDQTRTSLTAASTCYRCHFTYPHIGYSAFYLGTEAWSSPSGGHERLDAPSFVNRGHIYYMMRNPLMTNSSGYRPWGSDDPEWITPSDPSNTAAIEHSCGGSEAGICHFGGNRSALRPPPASRGWPACNEYCHR